MDRPDWHILTGEYPPTPGGVSDYTRNLACALAAGGERVHVWAPARGGLLEDPQVSTHPLRHGFMPAGLRELSRVLDVQRRPRRLLLQYVPQAFGWKGMNLPFCAWLAARRKDELWVMFHEVAVGVSRRAPWRHNALGVVTQTMASLLAARADRLFVSVPQWERFLRSFFPLARPATWLPIPSNVPTEVSASAIARVRASLPIPAGATVIGHFGTYGLMASSLAASLAQILAGRGERFALLLGRGAKQFVEQKLSPLGVDLRRVVVPGELSGEKVAAHLAACTLVIQPYPDGISSRRTSAMASLALGVAIVTNDGQQTEDVWRASGGVAIADEDTPEALARLVDDLLHADARRLDMATRGRDLYGRQFALARTVATLRSFDR